MGSRINKLSLIRAGLAAVALAASGAAMAQSAVMLTVQPTNTVLTDGQSVPMWGYTCGDVLSTPVPSTGATCTTMSGVAQSGTAWQPPLIRVPAGQTLTITLVNQLNFGTGDQNVPTSIVIDGQLGGGLGNAPATMASPTHAPYGTTWPGTLGAADAGSCADGTFGDTGTFCPPGQGRRVRSFGTEVAAGTQQALCWGPLCSSPTPPLRPGTYLIHSGTEPSIQHAMGLYGVLVVTESTTNSAYGTTFDADVPLLFSEIDPVQNRAVDAAVRNAAFKERATYAGPGMCIDPDTGKDATGAGVSTIACYPPAVNYTPLYYLVNGVSFDRTSLATSTLTVPATGTSGNVLLRLVNAGQRLHAPSIVGADMTPLAQDGNKVSTGMNAESSIPMVPGKTFDATVSFKQTTAGTYDNATYALFDRQLSISTNNQRDGGMQAYIQTGTGAGAGAVGSTASGVTLSALNPTYYCVAGTTLSVTDPAKGVLGGATGANGVGAPTAYTGSVNASNLSVNSDGTFAYNAATTCSGSFSYMVNGAQLHTATITECDAADHAATGCSLATPPIAQNFVVVSSVSSRYVSPPPGVLAHVTNSSGLVLSAVAGSSVNADGSFAAAGPGTTADCPTDALAAQVPAGATCIAVPYTAKDAQNQTSAATAYVAFLAASNLNVTVKDGPTGLPITDYRWIIEEDRTFWVDPKCQVNVTPRPLDSNGNTCPPLPVESLGYNFHSAHMPVVATGCVGTVSCEVGQKLQGADAVCDVGNGACRTDASQKTPVNPADVHLDPNKRYYISILPGDGINPTISGFGGTVKDCGAFSATDSNWKLYDPADGSSGNCGHEMGGTQVAPGATAVSVSLQQIPLPTAKIAAFVFQDDNPLNGENDAGGGVDIIAPNEPGLGGFELKLFDQAGQLGDATGQITYDEFNEPVSNSLAGYIDPLTGLDACPITKRTDGLVGMIPTCPKYESDGVTPSPLAGQAVIANLYPGLYEIQAFPAADRIARGEQWLQTNTLDGGKPHEAFIKPNEPGYFQEFGPGGFHVSIGFANPAIINARKTGYCSSTLNNGQPCNNTLTVEVTNNHMSRTPDQRTFDSGTADHYAFTQCYVSVGPADAEDFAFQPCVTTTDSAGNSHTVATFTGMPPGIFKMTVFDQWNDIMLDGLVGTVEVGGGGTTTTKKFPVTQWRTNLFTRTYIDSDGSGVSTDDKPGLSLVNTNIRYRDGSIGFFNNTDLNGYAGFNEVFPLMNWLVVETSTTRFKPTWTHSVYDAGGPVDCTTDTTILGSAAAPPCSTIAAHLANTDVRVPLPADLRVPGAKYCDNADCPASDAGGGASTGSLFPPQAFGNTMGWQGLLGQDTFMEFGVKPFKKAAGTAPAENGGIRGQVIYSSTRPFDDPALLLQLSWSPGIPHATVNLYSKSVDAQGNTVLKLVDTTQSASWDDWAQGFRTDASGNPIQITSPAATTGVSTVGSNAGYVPNMNCPGQDATSPFFATLRNSKQWLDTPDSSGNKKALAYQSQFKCYDGWSQLNQAQPAPYDGYYRFPSITAVNPTTGKPAATNCKACISNPDDGNPMLPAGTYVVEVIVPPGYVLIKEEDKNILMGDVYVAPVSQQFAGFGNIYILPDQASINAAYNASNPGNLNTTNALGAQPRHEGDTGSVETFWPCVGALRQVPDFNSEFPGAQQAAPFAGAMRNLCDRKEVKLADEMSVLAKFYLFSDTHIAGHFAGTITNDFASEFDPFSPQFGEKFGPPNLPVALRDFNGNEVARVYSDQWGIYNGLYFSTWSPNPPNPTGYAPQMSIACMNDPGPIMISGVATTDPAYSPAYSNFCYEQPFMPGVTTYMDTPVIPTQAFADGYNLPDTEYPDGTPAISSVTSGAASGPWVASTGSRTLTIRSLGDKVVQNPYFAGPNAAAAPYNTKTITRHYGFGGSGTAILVAPDGTTTAALTSVTWGDAQITGTIPVLPSAFNCKVQQSGSTAQCGQLVITRGDNGKRSIDAITVTVGGSAPWIVTPSGVTPPSGTTKTVKDYAAAFGRLNLSGNGSGNVASPLQVAIDSASPGDLILVTPGAYHENLIMWKPVRLQGAGGGVVTINADAHPAGHMDQWRRQNNCVFGLDLNGVPNPGNTNFDPTSSGYSCPNEMFQRVDRIPFEAIVGWDASGNGNLAQVLQEPTLMGAYEGAGITVLGRGVRIPLSSTDFWGVNATGGAGAFTDGSRYLTGGNVNTAAQANNLGGANDTTGNDCLAEPTRIDGRDYGSSNFYCNPSRIDGIAILNSSQGGGGLFIHGWAHNLEVSNTRISANHGTLAGAINLGNGETPDAFINDGTTCGVNPPVMPCPPVPPGTQAGAAIPFQFNVNVRIHHNMLWNNASIGDALFSGTPAGGGALTVSAGADNYLIDHNWIAGNLSTGDGGGLQHLGLSFNGKVNNNVVIFNQSTNPTLPTSGGGIVIEGANLDRQLNGQECGSTTDQDCPPGLGEGTGSVSLDGNLIYGNSAESGTGGGIRIQQVNGSADFIAFPTTSPRWFGVTLTNNIIANNVAGYDGGGVSLQDAMKVTLTNNTIASNDTTASAGVLFKTLGAINANTPPPGCAPQTDPTLPQDPSCLGRDAPHGPQPSGLVTMAHTPNLLAAIAALPGSLTSNTNPKAQCPGGFGYTNGSAGVNNADCLKLSRPAMVNNLFWQNRTFSVDILSLGTGLQSQQNLVALSPALNQTSSGACPTGAQFWDVGLRTDDVNAGTLSAALNKLAITYSVLTGTGDISSLNEVLTDSTDKVGVANPVVAQVCNGARVPPEYCLTGSTNGQNGAASCKGYNAPPGASETTSVPTMFVFNNIQPTATVDEGHNWLNLVYGPLYLAKPGTTTTETATPTQLLVASGSVGTTGSAYSLASGSAAASVGATQAGITSDYFGNPRPTGCGAFDIGAVQSSAGATCSMSITKTDGRTSVYRDDTTTYTIVVTNTGASPVTGAVVADTRPSAIQSTGWSWSCTAGAGASCGSTTSGTGNISATLGTLAAGSSVTFTATGRVSTTATSLANTATVTYPSGTGSATATVTDTDTVALTSTTSAVAFTSATLGSLSGTTTRTLAFGNLSGAQSSTVTITVSGAAVTFGAAAVVNGTGTAFTKGTDTCSGQTIASGSTCHVQVNFAAPNNNSARTGTLYVPNNSRNGLYQLSLTGS